MCRISSGPEQRIFWVSFSSFRYISEAYLAPSRVSTTEFFCENKLIAKSSVLYVDVWIGSKYVSGFTLSHQNSWSDLLRANFSPLMFIRKVWNEEKQEELVNGN